MGGPSGFPLKPAGHPRPLPGRALLPFSNPKELAELYDLRVTVESVGGFCDLPHRPGDYFEVRGSRLIVPEGRFVCLWALQSLMPMLPAKQRRIEEPNDWLARTTRMVCPDPNGMVLFRIEQLRPGGGVNDENVSGDLPGRLLVDETRCSGCRACEMICSFRHTGEFGEASARVRVTKREGEGIDRPQLCRQCGQARCVEVCPRQALSRDASTHAVLLDRERCSRCGACRKACPFGAVHGDGEGYPLICDLCGGQPACADRCATGAIRFGLAGKGE